MKLNEASTSDLLKEVIRRGIIPSEYKLIFQNTLRAPAPMRAGFFVSIQPYERQPGDGYEIACQHADLESELTPSGIAQRFLVKLTGPTRITRTRTIPYYLEGAS